jgi:4-carboxymuconolactone decarboxylase
MTNDPATASQHDITSAGNLARRDRGLAVLSRIDGPQGEAVIDSLADINPALGHHVAAFAFGDIYDRPGLDPRSRQLVTIGVLTALGGCEPQLKVHIGAALNVGLGRDEITEAILHAAVYAGFPRALNATFVAREAFAARDAAASPD